MPGATNRSSAEGAVNRRHPHHRAGGRPQAHSRSSAEGAVNSSATLGLAVTGRSSSSGEFSPSLERSPYLNAASRCPRPVEVVHRGRTVSPPLAGGGMECLRLQASARCRLS